MSDSSNIIGKSNSKPLVSVLVPTFNRPEYLYQALSSVLNQDYKNLQVLVINDGGENVGGIINSFNDIRLKYINRKENRGKAFSLNQALEHAKGKYVSYLDDDDLYYPNHIGTLVNVLENQTDCKVAYTDLYKAYCKVSPDGNRQVLSKVLEVSRDFDRFLMLYFNHVLHVSLMHRRDMIEKTGRYNENLNVLIDWDITRRLAFFSDFYHICKVTGEYYHPMGDCDRMSVQQRKNKKDYHRNVLAIRTTRPAKPWPKIQDMSIIFITDKFDKEAGKTISSIWQNTFYPYQIYLPISESDFNRINTDMPNLVFVPVSHSSSKTERIDAAIKKCDGHYIAIIQGSQKIEEMWVEKSLYALINCSIDRQGFLLDESDNENCSVIIKKEDIEYARNSFPQLSFLESLGAAGISLRVPDYEEYPFQFDNILHQAMSEETNGNWLRAAEMYIYLAENHKNQLWMKRLATKALFKAGRNNMAASMCDEINQQRPTIDTLLLEAKLRREEKKYSSAIELLHKAERTIQGKEFVWI
jgi:glycosyltransferase involved in cell wall biosynthesis